jgi:hypothetical protein
MNQEPPLCPTDCPNRTQKQLGKGYSYLFVIVMTGFLASQAVSLKASNERWEINLSPIPTPIYITGVGLIASALGLNTDKLAAVLGAALSGKKGEE